MFGRQSSIVSGMPGAMRPRRRSSMQQIMQEIQERFIRERNTPLCWKITQQIYHEYGLKHVVLLLVLMLYGFFGALIFVLIEGPAELRLKNEWRSRLDNERIIFVHDLMKELFNNSRYVIFLPSWKTKPIADHLFKRLDDFEHRLGVTFDPQQKISWDYWNAVLFAGTVCTTIGYGHIYPRTPAGRVLTCVYALFGIPLVLTVLNDMGKLLTVGMKFPWFQCKRAWRRLSRLCTHTPMQKILDIEKRERDNLAIFDLPILVAVGLIVGWIFLCSATFLMWEKRWSYLDAFYFFFISLSTVGLGDIIPDQPKYLLMMFGYIIVGLSLVSMSVNLIQMKLEKTYHGGAYFLERPSNIYLAEEPDGTDTTRAVSSPTVRATLGVLQSTTMDYSSAPAAKQTASIACQTMLTFPTTRRAIIAKDGGNTAVRFLKPRQRSLTNLLQPATEIQQQDFLRNALANVSDSAAVIVFVGDHDRGDFADYSITNDLRFRGRLVPNIHSIEKTVVTMDGNRSGLQNVPSDL